MTKYRIAFSVLLTLIFLFNSKSLVAQSDLSGLVLENGSGLSLPAAHVYLNGTTIGTYTNNDGYFSIKDIPDGSYQLVVRFVGYQTKILDFNTVDGPFEVTVYLEKDTMNLGDIVVRPNVDPEERERRMNVFREQFIGSSEIAEQAEILNPETIYFDYEPKTKVLTAFATEPIIIKNEALGYFIDFELISFDYNERSFISSYFGLPYFREIEDAGKRSKRKWKNNRDKSYLGSLEHFIASLISGTLEEEGFEVRAEQRKETSTSYERYVSRDTIELSDLLKKVNYTTFELSFQNYMNVTYKKEHETYNYRKWLQGTLAERNPSLVQPQNSILYLKEPPLKIDTSGYILNPETILVGGYWAFEKVGDMLPITYRPD